MCLNYYYLYISSEIFSIFSFQSIWVYLLILFIVKDFNVQNNMNILFLKSTIFYLLILYYCVLRYLVVSYLNLFYLKLSDIILSYPYPILSRLPGRVIFFGFKSKRKLGIKQIGIFLSKPLTLNLGNILFK